MHNLFFSKLNVIIFSFLMFFFFFCLNEKRDSTYIIEKKDNDEGWLIWPPAGLKHMANTILGFFFLLFYSVC